MNKKNLVVHLRKLIFKIYIKNHYIYIYKQNRGEENNIRKAHTSTWL